MTLTYGVPGSFILPGVVEKSNLINLEWSWMVKHPVSEFRSKNHSQWNEVTLIDRRCNRDRSRVFLSECVLASLHSWLTATEPSYLPTPSALSVSQQSEERRLLDALRSHYFARLASARRNDRLFQKTFPGQRTSHGYALVDDLFRPRVHSASVRQRLQKKAREKSRCYRCKSWRSTPIRQVGLIPK